jgi:hypothetical protein
LEGSDGAEQKLNAEALKNWSNSSAYFNGQSVKVSLYQAAGEEVKVKLKELKVSEAIQGKETHGVAQARKITSPSVPSSNAQVGEINLEDTPWAKAVGRFTNGNNSIGTGWIAPNGAIVTSDFTYYERIWENEWVDRDDGYDVIEFNVPNSNNDGSVNHPAPEDQYPINTTAIYRESEASSFKRGKYAWADVAILEPLKNSTGLLPGERQQQYLRILPNPSSFIVGGLEGTLFDILHYGNKEDDFSTDQYKVLKLSQVTLKEQKKYLSVIGNRDIDRDNIVLHDMENFLGSESGAPIMFQGTNVAIGVHTISSQTLPSSGLGFSHDEFRNALNNAFTSNVIYVDAAESLYDNLSGEIHKPYLLVGEGVSNAPDNAVIYIAKGNYNESVTINKPMTLKAPVCEVVIGAAGGASSRMMRPNIPPELFEEDDRIVFDDLAEEVFESASIKSFPNPFVDHTELHYSLNDESPVQVKVYDMLGQEVQTLLQEDQPEGKHSVQWDGCNRQGQSMPPGLYIMRLKTGEETTAVRVMKQ